MKKLLLILLCLPFIGFGQCEYKCNEVIPYTNAEYIGCINKNNKADGYGTLKLESGNSYIGCWKDGLKDGQGTYTYASGSKYVGQWKDDKKHGKGTYTWLDGAKYVGQWKDGDYNGQGTYTYASGSKYVGEYKDGKHWNGINTMYGDNKEESGLVIIYKYENGNVTDTIRNDRNYYNKEDIIGKERYCTIKLIGKKNKYDIILTINNIPIKWRFDTGAEDFSIGKNQWDKIKSKIDFEDLNITSKSKGVGGYSSGTVMRIKDEIEIGGYLVKNAIVSISNDDYSLMGIGFLKKFSNVEWNMKEATLKIYK